MDGLACARAIAAEHLYGGYSLDIPTIFDQNIRCRPYLTLEIETLTKAHMYMSENKIRFNRKSICVAGLLRHNRECIAIFRRNVKSLNAPANNTISFTAIESNNAVTAFGVSHVCWELMSTLRTSYMLDALQITPPHPPQRYKHLLFWASCQR